jgi:hypothetical protein
MKTVDGYPWWVTSDPEKMAELKAAQDAMAVSIAEAKVFLAGPAEPSVVVEPVAAVVPEEPVAPAPDPVVP